MRRGLCRLILGTLLTILVTHGTDGASRDQAPLPVVQRLMANDDAAPTQFGALRHLEATNDRFDRTAWMDAWTSADGTGFHYTIMTEGGSEYIRSRVLKPWLEAERKMWASGAPGRAAFTPDNYTFEDRGAEPGGLAWVGVKPKRKDLLLVDGSIFLRPEDGDLVRVQGLLSKNPSFWTRHVEIVRHYERIAGVRLPVAFESVANVLIAGKSTFTMSYVYQTVNGQPVSTSVP